MALRSARPHIVSVLLLVLLLALFPGQVEAGGEVKIPSLEEFIGTVSDGNAESLRGIYVPELLASVIIPQPEDDPAFVSPKENTLTQFLPASSAGSTGLLAHNYLAGKYFSRVKEQGILYLIYGDGRTEPFIVTGTQRFKALDPQNVWSDFLDLQHGGLFSSSSLFSKIYGQPGNLILQTCIFAGGDASWGRLFVIAEPYEVQVDEPETSLITYK